MIYRKISYYFQEGKHIFYEFDIISTQLIKVLKPNQQAKLEKTANLIGNISIKFDILDNQIEIKNFNENYIKKLSEGKSSANIGYSNIVKEDKEKLGYYYSVKEFQKQVNNFLQWCGEQEKQKKRFLKIQIIFELFMHNLEKNLEKCLENLQVWNYGLLRKVYCEQKFEDMYLMLKKKFDETFEGERFKVENFEQDIRIGGAKQAYIYIVLSNLDLNQILPQKEYKSIKIVISGYDKAGKTSVFKQILKLLEENKEQKQSSNFIENLKSMFRFPKSQQQSYQSKQSQYKQQQQKNKQFQQQHQKQQQQHSQQSQIYLNQQTQNEVQQNKSDINVVEFIYDDKLKISVYDISGQYIYGIDEFEEIVRDCDLFVYVVDRNRKLEKSKKLFYLQIMTELFPQKRAKILMLFNDMSSQGQNLTYLEKKQSFVDYDVRELVEYFNLLMLRQVDWAVAECCTKGEGVDVIQALEKQLIKIYEQYEYQNNNCKA